jgi:hypothetical protein
VDLSAPLIKHGFSVKFVDKYLVCNASVTVFLCAGRVAVEGPLSDDYFEVRRLVYSQFVLLQGSRASLLDNYNINLNAD